MTRIRSLLAGTVALTLLCGPTALAQQAPASETTEPTSVPDPCAVDPADGEAPASPGGVEQGMSRGDEPLSDRLGRCGGVLSPPPVGDPEMVEPAPDAGATPIIPPSALPDND